MILQKNFIVATLPMKIKWADRDANLKALSDSLEHLRPGTDLLVLPELFSTGYVNDPQLLADIAELNTGATIDFIKDIAKKHNIAIAGSFLARTANKVYNRAFFIEPSGEETFYDKRHLFSLSDESKVIAQGVSRIPVIRFRGWNIAMIVCYDLRFPVWCRSRRNSYDMLVVPANWPSARGYAWEHLLIARAIENQSVVVGANRGGSDDYGNYDGLSFVFDPMGMPVGYCIEDSPFVYADLDKQSLESQRLRFPLVNDGDDFDIAGDFI